ncbi:hypothetical protein GALL_456110 [mine drainage metagenome]|uniref:Uncharacterized protein n=1 Tax=mine drainage metagenome TaxID=410659 RepID=A0A1J5PY73_9ZZZZ
MIDQRGVIGRPPCAEAAVGAVQRGQGRRQHPAWRGDRSPHALRLGAARRRSDLHRVGQMFASGRGEQQAAGIEKSTGIVQIRRTHRQVIGIDRIAQTQRPAARRDAPAVLGDLVHLHRLATAPRLHLQHMARKLAHQIASGNPYRQPEFLPCRCRVGQIELHPELVGVQVLRHHAVVRPRWAIRLRGSLVCWHDLGHGCCLSETFDGLPRRGSVGLTHCTHSLQNPC